MRGLLRTGGLRFRCLRGHRERPGRSKLLDELATIALAKHEAETGSLARTLVGAFEGNAGESGAGTGLGLKTGAFAKRD